MKGSVLLDTGFLISLVDESRSQHDVAKQYYQYLLSNNYNMFISTLVASEFAIRQPITDLPLHSFRILPFNLRHAIKAAELNFKKHRQGEDARDIVKEDFKILSQAEVEKIPLLLTEDSKTLYRYCEQLRQEHKLSVRAIKLVDGFQSCWFEDGQESLNWSIPAS